MLKHLLLSGIAVLSLLGCSRSGSNTEPEPLDSSYLAQGTDQGPWVVSPPAPTRELYVSPTGTGDGSKTNPMSLNSAREHAEAGDWYWLMAGEYPGEFEFTEDGTEQQPIVYRAMPGAHVKITGGFHVNASDIWVWGLEFSDPNGVAANGCVHNQGVRTRMINNVIHDCDNALGAWDKWDMIFYGNIIYHGHHNIYTQNSAERGKKYFVNNISVDAVPWENNGPYEFHAYGENSGLSGFVLHRNIFANFSHEHTGEMLMGGRNKAPNADNKIDENYFYRVQAHMGYKRPNQAVFTRNFLYRAPLIWEFYWGEGEARYAEPAANLVKNNRIYAPGAEHIRFRTSAYINSMIPDCEELPCRSEGQPAIRSQDEWDDNTYSEPFSARFFAKDINRFDNPNVQSLNDWQSLTQSAGKAFDLHAKLAPLPTGQKVVLLGNAYERGRAHLAIYNFDDATGTVALNLSAVVPEGWRYQIHKIKDAFGTPVAQGIHQNTSVSVPYDKDFSLYLITSQPAGESS